MTDTRARQSLTSVAVVGRGISDTDLILEDVGDTDVLPTSKVIAVETRNTIVKMISGMQTSNGVMVNNQVQPSDHEAEKLATPGVIELCREVSLPTTFRHSFAILACSNVMTVIRMSIK